MGLLVSIAALAPTVLPANANDDTDVEVQTWRTYIRSGQRTDEPIELFVPKAAPHNNAVATLVLHKGDTTNSVPSTTIWRNQERTLPGGRDARGAVFWFAWDPTLSHRWLPAVRRQVELRWTESNGESVTTVHRGFVAFASPSKVYGWTIAILIVAVVLVILLDVLKRKDTAYCILCSPSGRLSLSKFQMAVWTLAISWGFLVNVLSLGAVPQIPLSLVVLMGLSLTTGTLSYVQALDVPHAPTKKRRWHPADLIYRGDHPSISRAQMLLWTVILVVAFLQRTRMGEPLWDIPWELAALMGVSQAGYLGHRATLRRPETLEYPQKSYTFKANEPIDPSLRPRLTPATLGVWTVQPNLPEGVSLDHETGSISGTPTKAAAKKSYTITVRNVRGSATFDLDIEVKT
jgi:hypothetical protein